MKYELPKLPEPGVVGYLCFHSRSEPKLSLEFDKPSDVPEFASDVVWHTPLIDMQSHREEVEPLREALQACIDALGTCRVMTRDSAGNYTREVTPKVIVDALAKANEALK